jgi:hypothetical protein
MMLKVCGSGHDEVAYEAASSRDKCPCCEAYAEIDVLNTTVADLEQRLEAATELER